MSARALNIFVRRLRHTAVYDSYWRYAAERQQIFFSRLSGNDGPWTNDETLQTFRFTNVYRATDRVSQYLIRNVIYRGSQKPQEVFFRTILFKIFNRVETWELLTNQLGTISVEEFDLEKYDAILAKALASGRTIFSAAYIMPTGGKSGPKHSVFLKLVKKMLDDGLPKQIEDAANMADVYRLLISYPLIGPFLSYQFATDLNYSNLTNFDEMSFVKAGPGARDGISKCFSDLDSYSPEDVIGYVCERQEKEFAARGLSFSGLWGRRMQLIDCQNVFCEISKYARQTHPDVVGSSGRTRIKQRFSAKAKPITVWLPPKWGLNESIGSETVQKRRAIV